MQIVDTNPSGLDTFGHHFLFHTHAQALVINLFDINSG